MANVISFNYYKLQQAVSSSDFLFAKKKMTDEFASKQKGRLSSMALVDNDIWADFTVFESIDDLKAFAKAFHANETAKQCFSFMDFGTMNSHVFTVKKSYRPNDSSKEPYKKGNIVSFHSYKLNEGVSAEDYLNAADKLINEFALKQSGWISSMKVFEGDTWADFVVFESMDALKSFVEAYSNSEQAKAVSPFMDFGTLKYHTFTIEQLYQP